MSWPRALLAKLCLWTGAPQAPFAVAGCPKVTGISCLLRATWVGQALGGVVLVPPNLSDGGFVF